MNPRVLIVDDNAELLGLLGSAFEEAGYRVLKTQRGRAALEQAKAERPDVAVVDVLLPDVMGYEVASFLRQLKIPFVLVSGVFKGGRQTLDAVQRHGAVAYFEKPFEVERLLERVASLVPPPSGRGAAPADAGADDEPSFQVEIDEGETGTSVELTGRVTLTEGTGSIVATLSGEPIRVNSPAPVRTRPPEPPRGAPPVVSPIAGSLAPSAAGLATGPDREEVTIGGSHLGLLQDNLPQLISAFYLAQETGELVCQRGQVRKIVYFEHGSPVFATSNLATDRFGQFLVRVSKVQADDLKAAAHVAERTQRRTGDVLIDMGLLTDTERMYYVGQQVKAVIYSLFAWEDGRWHIAFKRRARAETLKLDLHPANLITRGVKKLYSPARLARLMPDHAMPIPAQDPSYLLSDVELESWEAMLLSRVDGSKSVAGLVALAKKPVEQVRGLLVALLSLKIVEFAK